MRITTGSLVLRVLLVASVLSLTVPSVGWSQARQAEDSIDQTLEEDLKRTGADIAEGDRFGQIMALDGDTLVVGVPFIGGTNRGAVYVFERNQGGSDNWGQVKKITPRDAANSDMFGNSVAIEGDRIVAGAGGNDPAGSAYIFERDVGGTENWGEVKRLLPSDAHTFHGFGGSVSVVGDTIVVGANADDDACPETSNCNSGSAYIFEKNDGGFWVEVTKLLASDLEAGDQFGISVSMSGDTIAVGAAYADEAGAGSNSGAAYLFSRDQGGPDAWGEVAKLFASDADIQDLLGESLSLDQNSLAVSARLDDTACPADPDCNSGAVYMFEKDPGSGIWGEVAKVTRLDAEAGHYFGTRVDLSGESMISGSPGDDYACPTDPGCNSGAAFVFQQNIGGPGNWGQLVKLVASDGHDRHGLGSGSAVEGNTAVVGTIRDWDACPGDPDCLSGAVYLYRFDARADLSISKDDGHEFAVPGTTIVYELSVANNGPFNAVSSTVTDVFNPLAFEVAEITWTCAPNLGAGPGTDCPVNGTGTDLEAGVNVGLESGDEVTFVVLCPLLPNASGTVSNTATIQLPPGILDPFPGNNSSTDLNALRELDFGDAPDPSYPTVLSSNGARHAISPGPHLGAVVDPDNDGQPNPSAQGDDSDGIDDEDGVFFTSALIAGVNASVDVSASASGGVLNAWFDQGGDGSWADTTDHIFTDFPLAPGGNSLNFQLSSSSAAGQTFARFRLDSGGGISHSGLALDGEVEDYQVTVTREADLEILKADLNDPVGQGWLLTYKITVINHGPSDSTSLTVTDVLPAEVSFVSSEPGEPVCSEAGGQVTCTFNELKSGDQVQTDIVVEVDSDFVGELTNSARVAGGDTDPVGNNDLAIEDTEVLEAVIFADSFESGDTSTWSSTVQ